MVRWFLWQLISRAPPGTLSELRGAPNGLEVSRPPARAGLASLYVSLARKASVHFSQLGGSAPPSCWVAGKVNDF